MEQCIWISVGAIGMLLVVWGVSAGIYKLLDINKKFKLPVRFWFGIFVLLLGCAVVATLIVLSFKAYAQETQWYQYQPLDMDRYLSGGGMYEYVPLERREYDESNGMDDFWENYQRQQEQVDRAAEDMYRINQLENERVSGCNAIANFNWRQDCILGQ